MIYERTVANGDRYDADKTFIFPWRADCDFDNDGWGCSWREVFYTQQAAEWAESHHEHFKTYQTRRYNYLSIAELYWIELDRVVDKLREPIQGDPLDVTEEVRIEAYKLQGRAQGLAFAIVKACQPYYADEKAVSVEANRRYKMRNGLLDWEPTPGFKYDPPIPGKPQSGLQGILGGGDEPVRVNTSRTSPAETAAKKLSADDQDAIRRAGKAGMFTPADLAKVYSTTVDAINWLLKDIA